MNQRTEAIKAGLRELSQFPDMLPVEPDDSPDRALTRGSLRALFGLLLESKALQIPDADLVDDDQSEASLSDVSSIGTR